jgi:hypothetical protein
VTDENPDIRWTAAERLAEINKASLGEKNADLRATVGKLTDQKLLAKIAVKDKDPDVRQIAAKRLAEQKLLTKLELEARSGKARRAAIEKLADKTLLTRIANGTEPRGAKA